MKITRQYIESRIDYEESARNLKNFAVTHSSNEAIIRKKYSKKSNGILVTFIDPDNPIPFTCDCGKTAENCSSAKVPSDFQNIIYAYYYSGKLQEDIDTAFVQPPVLLKEEKTFTKIKKRIARWFP